MRFPLSATARGAAVLALAACGVRGATALDTPGLAPAPSTLSMPSDTGVRDQTADQQVVHVLNRLAFGPRPGDVEAVRAMGVDRWIERQLHPSRIDDEALARFAASNHHRIRRPAAELARDYPPAQVALARMTRMGDAPTAADSMRVRRSALEGRMIVAELQSAKLARAVASERQLEEVLVDFWENHFSVFSGKGWVHYYLPLHTREAIRPHVLGSFRELLGAVARSPAMLIYLDNWQSAAEGNRPSLAPRAGGPRIIAGGPARRRSATRPPTTEPPVIRPPVGSAPREAGAQPARPAARRGLNENYARELMELHTLGVDGGYTQDDVIAVARAFTGWSVADPRMGGGFLFRPEVHDAGTKRVLGTLLPAGRGIEDGEAVLDLLARHPSTARFIATKLARRFVSDEPPESLVARAAEVFLRTDGNIREVVRTIVTSPEFFSREAYRAKVKSPFELVASTARAMGAEPDPTPRTARLVAQLGQPLYGAQTPNGYPETSESWINSGAILARINFGLLVGAGRAPGIAPRRLPAADSLVRAPREDQVDAIARMLLQGEISPDTRAVLLSGENPLARREPDDRTARPGGLALMLGLAIGAPEFQRR